MPPADRNVSVQQAVTRVVNFVLGANEFCRTQLFKDENMAIKHSAAISETFVDLYKCKTVATYRFYSPALRKAGGM